ncbi:hypothetical protein [Castellaniella sp. UC4442_H9]
MTTTQPQATTLAQVRTNVRRDVAIGFGNLESFELMQRAARLLSSSTLVPAAYRATIEKTDRYGNVTDTRENPNALANAVVALNMSQRMGADPLMVMQNLYIVEGRPSWSSQWIIAAINGCGRFSPLRFDIKDMGDLDVEFDTFEWKDGANGRRQRETITRKVRVHNKEGVAWTVESGTTIPQFGLEDLKEHGGVYGCCKKFGVPIIESPAVSIEMAVKEGWYTKNGSKWQTMPDVMLRYRTASFFGKLYAPELLMGLQTVEEAQDIIEATTGPDGTIQVDVGTLRAQTAADQAAAPTTKKDPAGDVTDVNMNTPSEQAKAEAGKPAAPAESSAPAYLDAGKVLANIQRSTDQDVLSLAADEIRDCDPARQAELKAAYEHRRDELDGVVHEDTENPFPESEPQPARQTRTRRAAAADME